MFNLADVSRRDGGNSSAKAAFRADNVTFQHNVGHVVPAGLQDRFRAYDSTAMRSDWLLDPARQK
tara:strand:- start:46659 stop:46853 length:195 start_codon:yes stop_codon:yes gene_type:complete